MSLIGFSIDSRLTGYLSIYLSFLRSRHEIVLTSCIVVKYNITLGGFLCAPSSLISTVSNTVFVFWVF